MTDPFKIVKEVQKGLKGLTKKLEKSKNPRLKEMEKRLRAIDKKMEDEFGGKREKGRRSS